MISFDEFLKQDEADKYNMLQECNAIIQQKENIIKEVITYIEWLRNEHHKTENLGYTKAVYNTNELLVILHKLRGE